MSKYFEIFYGSFTGYWDYLFNEITHPRWDNYFYCLIGISLFFWSLELIIPWRKKQKAFRKDFWLDAFYMFFNFFIFSLIGYNAISNIGVQLFTDFLALFGIKNSIALEVQALPIGILLLFAFILNDFIQWSTHVLLHKNPWLWQFHKLHHSVKEMGFAAHLRYHWMEIFVYKSIQYVPMAILGFGLQEFFAAHMIALAIGHFNHSNINIPLGPLKYIFNNPQMHIWHHAKELPKKYSFGVNFGISLSIWDYIFKTDYIPSTGRDIELGFDDDEKFPQTFVKQEIYPFYKGK